jgi:hypothetical protein
MITVNEWIPLVTYYLLLDRHDWQYEYADDHRVWQSGSDEHKRLERLAQSSTAHADLYAQFRAYHAGKSPAKPVRPGHVG